jgi:hypothetical protein
VSLLGVALPVRRKIWGSCVTCDSSDGVFLFQMTGMLTVEYNLFDLIVLDV